MCTPARWPYPVVSDEGSAQPPSLDADPPLNADPLDAAPPPRCQQNDWQTGVKT